MNVESVRCCGTADISCNILPSCNERGHVYRGFCEKNARTKQGFCVDFFSFFPSVKVKDISTMVTVMYYK